MEVKRGLRQSGDGKLLNITDYFPLFQKVKRPKVKGVDILPYPVRDSLETYIRTWVSWVLMEAGCRGVWGQTTIKTRFTVIVLIIGFKLIMNETQSVVRP